MPIAYILAIQGKIHIRSLKKIIIMRITEED